MTQTRQRGLLNLLMGTVLLCDSLLFQAWIQAERHFSIVGLVEGAQPAVYTIAILLPFLRPPRRLHRALDKVASGRLLTATAGGLMISLTMGLGFALIYGTLKDTSTSRMFLLYFVLWITPFNILLVRFLPGLLSRAFFPAKAKDRAILVGNGALPAALSSYLEKCDNLGIGFVGYYADEEQPNLDMFYLGTMDDFKGTNLEPLKLDRILAYNSDSSSSAFSYVIERCQRLGIRLQLYTRFTNFKEPIRVVQDGDLQFLAFTNEPLEDPVNKYLKRAFDIAVALPVVLFILPVLAVLVKIAHGLQSPGPLFFKQERYGQNRKRFGIYKFRTMHECPGGDEARQATMGDTRIFPLGNLLRRTSLDEFPQFLNVLRGEMSIIGPRPHLVQHDTEFEKVYHTYRSRHFVKPGITGYAQIKGFRGEIKGPSMIVDRVRSDIHYVNNWSLGLDCYILVRTIVQVLRPPKSAY